MIALMIYLQLKRDHYNVKMNGNMLLSENAVCMQCTFTVLRIIAHNY